MSEKPTPPEGYRLLEPGERTEGRDIRFRLGSWNSVPYTLSGFRIGCGRSSGGWYYARPIDEPQFQVGDRVRVKERDGEWDHWCSEMDLCVGQTGTVKGTVTQYDTPTVRVQGDGWWWKFRPHALEKLPAETESGFTLEPGQWYRTRNGIKVFVVSPVPDGVAESAGFIGVDEHGDAFAWQASGRYRHHAQGDDLLDIIGPWIDEPTDEEVLERLDWLYEQDRNYFPDISYRNRREFVESVKYRSEHDA